MKKFLCAVLFVLVLAGLSYAIEDAGNEYVLEAWNVVDFTFTAANSEQIADLDRGDVVTIRGIVQHNQYGFVTLYNCEIIE